MKWLKQLFETKKTQDMPKYWLDLTQKGRLNALVSALNTSKNKDVFTAELRTELRQQLWKRNSRY